MCTIIVLSKHFFLNNPLEQCVRAHESNTIPLAESDGEQDSEFLARESVN